MIGELIMKPTRYTANGYSHKSLRDKAKKFRKNNPNIKSLQQAKNTVAQQIAYSNWKRIESEKIDKKRDSFYREAFSNNNKYKPLYEEHLKRSSKEPSMSEYRMFLVKYYENVEANKTEGEHVIKLYPVESILKEIISRIEAHGVESILPQNLPNYLFEPIIQYFYTFLDDDESGEYEEDEEASMVPNQIIILLLGAQENIKNTSFDGKFEITLDVLINNIKTYYLYLNFEQYSRVMGFKYTKPTLENIFDTGTSLEIDIPKDFEEYLFKMFDNDNDNDD